MTSVISTSKNNNKSTKDKYMQTLINISSVILIIIIIVLIYKYFIESNYRKLKFENFEILQNINPITTIANMSNIITESNTIYETSIKNIYGTNKRLVCSMLPNIFNSTNVCVINNNIFVPYKFPVHMIKIIDGSIVAVFNDGRLYKKDSIKSTMWGGPIINSMPLDTIPMRMITLSTDLATLLGVGFDNILYIKTPDKSGNINLTIPWKQVPNNSSIIYVLFDNQTHYLLSIDINGKLFTKTSSDIITNNYELNTKLDRPILRLYYDLNGYMLAIDKMFDLYQFTEINWKTSPLNITRGANNSKLQDLLYDNDGKMYGLVFNSDAFMVQIMKQTSVFYLADFININDIMVSNNSNSTENDFLMSDLDIIKSKIGSIIDYSDIVNAEDETDDDPNFAYQKQIIESKKELYNFCANRNVISNDSYDNYDLLTNVDKNNDKISNLKNILNSLMNYEPDNMSIREKNPIIA